MRLKLTLLRPSGVSDDIVVTADAAASISDVAATIARLDPRASSPVDPQRVLTLHATLPGQSEALLLPPDAPLGEAWIGSGATVGIADGGTYYLPPAAGKPPIVAMLTVVSGPDAGREFPLRAGTTVLGREEGNDIVLNDPLVSKRHVRFEASSAVEVIDLGSANGVVVDGGIVTRLRIEKTETLLIGDSEVRIAVTEATALAGVAPKAGPIFFNRSPKVERRYAGAQFAAPEVPAERQEQPFPLLAMITPLLMGGAMFILTRQPTSLLFVAMSPVMMVGNFLTGKSREKRRLRKAIGRFDVHLSSLTAQLEEERVRELELRINESPSTAEAYD
ncbi:MAG TPA: FHA domain-containing protein, partial [Lacisediminihabitans sp.]|uniref:FHA domain-containing protein n=1 Tax=Lacisediminihabitans sp. TaxID=2787631 RepID=UPI002ED81C0D